VLPDTNCYSFTDPGALDGRLSRPCWLTDSGRFTHKVVTLPAVSLAQDKESTLAEPAVLTTMLRHQAVFHFDMSVLFGGLH